MHEWLIKLGAKFLKGNNYFREGERKKKGGERETSPIEGTIFQRVVTSRSPRVPDLFTSLEWTNESGAALRLPIISAIGEP